MRNKLIITGFISIILISIFVYQYHTSDEIILSEVNFTKIPDWNNITESDLKNSIETLKKSCKVFAKSNENKAIGNKHFELKVKDILPICEKINNLSSTTNLKKFFENNFSPYIYKQSRPIEGLFTGYYMPELQGSHTKTKQYSVPLYSLPKDLIDVNLKAFKKDININKLYGRVDKQKLIPYHSRKDINNGALKDTKVIAWISSEVDRQLLEIEGSGIIKFPDNEKMYIGYAGENGRKYKSLATILIEQGALTKDTATEKNIRNYFKENKQNHDDLYNQNESFVFFKKLPNKYAQGAQNIELTGGYSMAIDPKFIPYGIPLFLSTQYLDYSKGNEGERKNLHRVMIAQDTGGAIKGAVRGDIFWGEGKDNVATASRMYAKGYYWLLLPKKSDVK